MELTTEQRDALEEWISSRPAKVAAAVRAHPPTTCYRATDNPGHYLIVSYDEPVDGSAVTVKISHGSDSYLPGVNVFGVDPGTLVVCDCGTWRAPSAAQMERTDAAIAERVKVLRSGH